MGEGFKRERCGSCVWAVALLARRCFATLPVLAMNHTTSAVSSSSSHPSVSDRDPASLPADELYLEPIDGMAKWLGDRLNSLVLRGLSMEEQEPRKLSTMITPVEGYFRRDRHVHPVIDPTEYRLELRGFGNDQTLTLEDLLALPREERVCVQECAGNGNHLMGSAGLVGQARWCGPSLQTILEKFGGTGQARHIVFRGSDTLGPIRPGGYHYGLSIEELTASRALVAVEMNGAPLSRRHGYPARLIVPGIYSMSHVKWLRMIEGKRDKHQGIYNTVVFVNKRRQGGKWVKEEARWIGLKSMISCCIRNEDHYLLMGCAWGGQHPIARVEVCTDGETWHGAELSKVGEYFADDAGLQGADVGHGWSVFRYRWDPKPGKYKIACRAYDIHGTPQTEHNDPDVKGHFNQTRVKWRRVVVPRV